MHAGDRSNDYPVVLKSYSTTHAGAACLQSILLDNVLTSFTESLSVVDASWNGLWLSDLLRLTKTLKTYFDIHLVVSRSMTDVVERTRFPCLWK